MALALATASPEAWEPVLEGLVELETHVVEGNNREAGELAEALSVRVAGLEEPMPRVIRARLALGIGSGLAVGEIASADHWLFAAETWDLFMTPGSFYGGAHPLADHHPASSWMEMEAALPWWMVPDPEPVHAEAPVWERGRLRDYTCVRGDGKQRRPIRVLYGLYRGIRVGRPFRRVIYGGCVLPFDTPHLQCPDGSTLVPKP